MKYLPLIVTTMASILCTLMALAIYNTEGGWEWLIPKDLITWGMAGCAIFGVFSVWFFAISKTISEGKGLGNGL